MGPVELSLEPALDLKQLVLLVVHSPLHLKFDKLRYAASVDFRTHGLTEINGYFFH